MVPGTPELAADLVNCPRIARPATGQQHLQQRFDRGDLRHRTGRVAPARAGSDAEIARKFCAGLGEFGEAHQRFTQQLTGLVQGRDARLRGQRARVNARAFAQRDESGPQLLLIASAAGGRLRGW